MKHFFRKDRGKNRQRSGATVFWSDLGCTENGSLGSAAVLFPPSPDTQLSLHLTLWTGTADRSWNCLTDRASGERKQLLIRQDKNNHFTSRRTGGRGKVQILETPV